MPFRIVAISGSLRKASYNTGIIRAAQSLLPSGWELIQADVNLPLYNQDNEKNPGDGVIKFQQLVKTADALLLVSPEHNYLLSAAMKNALDWGSRTYQDGKGPTNIFFGKTGATLSAGGAAAGTKAQYSIRIAAVTLNIHMLNKPEVGIPVFLPEQMFNPTTGDVSNPNVTKQIKGIIDGLVDLTLKFKK